MYQYATHYPLANSKVYIEKPLQAVPFLKKCVEVTNQFRKSKGEKPLTKEEIFQGQRLLKLDFETNPDVMKLMGKPIDLNIDNLLDSSGE